jgi:PP-loop superfamily ATP-utilizing enzyme
MAAGGGSLNKEQRFNQLNEARKLKREELLMQRRGLNFISDAAIEKMDEDQITTLESEVDNIAPKIVGILGLSKTCDVKGLRTELVKHCIQYQL